MPISRQVYLHLHPDVHSKSPPLKYVAAIKRQHLHTLKRPAISFPLF